jgi:hypothetical protein
MSTATELFGLLQAFVNIFTFEQKIERTGILDKKKTKKQKKQKKQKQKNYT